ncbi:immunity 17 family protein [bacterium]|nr:immunity 17 family protein [bacterium]
MSGGNIAIIIGGVFTITCAMADFDWFMNNSRAKLFVTIFGRNGARIFYIILGIILVFLGLFYTK